MPDALTTELRTCMLAARTAAARTTCETKFRDKGGIVTPDGGKVFKTTTDSTYVSTNGGKVFAEIKTA